MKKAPALAGRGLARREGAFFRGAYGIEQDGALLATGQLGQQVLVDNRPGAATVIGTTAVFPYIQAPVLLAARGGRTTVEINPGDTMLSEIVTHRLRIGAADAMRHIWTRYQAATR